jgi:hypothetical protein
MLNDQKGLLVNVPQLGLITIQQLPSYEKIYTQLNDEKSIRITSELIIPIKIDDGVKNVKDLSKTVCQLLSICRGSKISWIYYICYDENGAVICQVHNTSTTFPLSSLPELIPSDFWGIPSTQAFLEGSYQATIDYPILNEYLGRLSDLYIDARSGRGYIDTQGLKLVVLIEILAKYVLTDPRFEIQETILKDNEAACLKTGIMKVIKSTIPDKDVRSALYDNLSCINHTPFKKLIEQLCETIGLKIDESDITLFVNSRNAIIHTGFFYCEKNNPEIEKADQLSDDVIEEYRFIINFIDKILLKLFNYAGDYNNITKWGKNLVY